MVGRTGARTEESNLSTTTRASGFHCNSGPGSSRIIQKGRQGQEDRLGQTASSDAHTFSRLIFRALGMIWAF